MRRLPMVLVLLLTSLALPTLAGPALAKGATSVKVAGPGIDDRRLGYTPRTDDVDVGSLAEAAGLYGIFGADEFTARPDLSSAELGPRYVLTWFEGNVFMVESHVYPFAEGGAWARIPDGSQMWGEPVDTGWWHGGSALRRQLQDLGAVAPVVEEPDAAAGAVAAIDSTSDPDPAAVRPWPLVTTGVVAGAVLAVFVGWWVRRRRLQPG